MATSSTLYAALPCLDQGLKVHPSVHCTVAQPGSRIVRGLFRTVLRTATTGFFSVNLFLSRLTVCVEDTVLGNARHDIGRAARERPGPPGLFMPAPAYFWPVSRTTLPALWLPVSHLVAVCRPNCFADHMIL